jgi:hypothetical protein
MLILGKMIAQICRFTEPWESYESFPERVSRITFFVVLQVRLQEALKNSPALQVPPEKKVLPKEISS